MTIILVQNVHTNLTKSVIVGIVEAVSVPWLSETSSRLHLFLLHIQDGLREQIQLIVIFYLEK